MTGIDVHLGTQITQSAAETHALAQRIAQCLEPGDVLALYGDLGSGKTCFVQGLAEALDSKMFASSPTYTIINEYSGKWPIYHIDLYRMKSSHEALAFGLEEYYESDGITAIEWADKAGEFLPANALHLRFQPGERADQRSIEIALGKEQAS